MAKGTKHDQDKAPLDLIPYEAQVEIAKVLKFGAEKYGKGNFANGLEHSRLIAAAMRHLGQYNSGEDVDSESGLSHVAHAGCMIAFLLYMQKHHPALDDRWAKKAPIQKKIEPFRLQIGKRYRRRDGEITGLLERANREKAAAGYPFFDPMFSLTYTASGEFEKYAPYGRADLIEELD